MCACGETTEDVVFKGKYEVIESDPNYGNYVVWEKESHIIYDISHGGYIVPHQIYQNGVIYGAVYENGEIVPIPYAMGITWDMLSLASKYLN
jgi:hypothetical protein